MQAEYAWVKSRLCFNWGEKSNLSFCLHTLIQLKIPGYWESINWLNWSCATGEAQESTNLYVFANNLSNIT